MLLVCTADGEKKARRIGLSYGVRFLIWTLCFVVAKPCMAPADVFTLTPNRYASVVEVKTCRNWMRVDTTYRPNDQPEFQQGDTVIVIQMKGALADSAGTLISMGMAGRFERNIIARRSLDTIYFVRPLLVEYNPAGIVQLVRIAPFPLPPPPDSGSGTGDTVISALPFDGRCGGVMALHNTDTIRLWCRVSATGLGFRPAEGICVAGRSPNAGTSGRVSSSGGGHGGAGGAGLSLPQEPTPQAGKAISYTAGVNWIFLGGGPGSGINGEQTRGGGIIIIDAPAVDGAGIYGLEARGENGQVGMGGGAGGAILITSRVIRNMAYLDVSGGNTASGGAGGGGVIRIGTITPMNLPESNYAGGTARQNPQGNGQPGKLFYNVTINEATSTYHAPVVSFPRDTAVCDGESLTLRVSGGESPLWRIDADTVCRDCDSLRITPPGTATLMVYALAEGCMDSAQVRVTVHKRPQLALESVTMPCDKQEVILTGPPGFARYRWSTGDTTQNVAVRGGGVFSLEVWTEYGCSNTDTVEVFVDSAERLFFDAVTTGSIVQLQPTVPYRPSSAVLRLKNGSSQTVIVNHVLLSKNVQLSVPLHQFPLVIDPYGVAEVVVVGEAPIPGVYDDVLLVQDACGTPQVALQFTVHEEPWYTRCNVRITSDGEIESLNGLNGANITITDLLGRTVVPPLPPGLYYLHGGSVTVAVQRP